MVETLYNLKMIGFWWLLFYAIIALSFLGVCFKFIIIMVRGYPSNYDDDDDDETYEDDDESKTYH